MVTKTLNDAFGYDGWCLEVKNTTREDTIKDDKGRYHVAYIATVRITHRKSGVYREDCGSGDAIDRSLASASGNALKGAVTDAMKRAAKHFGEKMGNALYHDGFNANNAPPTLKEALNTLDIERAKSRFGFDKDRKIVAAPVVQNNKPQTSNPSSYHQMAAYNASTSGAIVKQEQSKQVNNIVNKPSSYAQQQQTPRTQYVGNVVMEQYSNLSSNHSKANNNGKTSTQHVTPHHGASANTATSSNQNNESKPTNTYVTPGGNGSSATSTKKKSTTTFDASVFAAVPAEQLNNNTIQKQKQNANPQSNDGLALPQPRPGTSRGGASDNSPTSAYIANLSNGTTGTTTATPSMFGANGTLSQALAVEQKKYPSLAQTLKRKSESMDSSAAAANKSANNNSGAKNPYSQG